MFGGFSIVEALKANNLVNCSVFSLDISGSDAVASDFSNDFIHSNFKRARKKCSKSGNFEICIANRFECLSSLRDSGICSEVIEHNQSIEAYDVKLLEGFV